MTVTSTGYDTTQRYWDDLNEGDQLTPLVFELTLTKMVQQVSGSQDFYPVHHDTDFARSGGHADMFINTRFTRAAFGRLLGDLVGTEGWIKRLEYAMRRPNLLGDTIRVTAKVTKKYEADGEALLDLELGIENDRDGVATPGTATVMLPKR